MSQWRLPVGLHWTANDLNNCMLTRILSVNLVAIHINILDCIDPDGVSGCSDGYDENHYNEDWALWDENNHDFYMIPFRASSGYKPPRSRQMPVSMLYFVANLFEEIDDETNRYTSETNLYNKNLQSAKLLYLSYLELRKKVTEDW
jgi:hypothetical protein